MRKPDARKEKSVKQQATETDKQRWKVLKIINTEY